MAKDLRQTALSFVAIAERDLGMAGELVAKYPDGAAFHLQQAAEKLLKALLTVHDLSFPATTHQLDVLVGLLPATDPFYEEFVDFSHLTAAATRYRYPTPGGFTPSPPDVKSCRDDHEKLSRLLPEIRDHVREFENG